jgi:2-polyprenyl-6-methoxyphenol hydroxylase-like FAD-dependent oxidoreductase
MINSLKNLRCAGLVAFALASAISPTHGHAATQSVQTDSVASGKTLVTQLAARQFSDVSSRFDDRMKAALPQDKLGSVWDTVVSQVGAFRRISHAEVTDKDGLRVVIVGCEFENATLNAKIVFAPDGRVAGLFFLSADAS